MNPGRVNMSDSFLSRIDFSSPDQARQSKPDDFRRQKDSNYMENVNSRKRTFEMNSNGKMRKSEKTKIEKILMSDRKSAKQNKPKFMQQVRTGWSNTQKAVNFQSSQQTSSPLLPYNTAQKKGDHYSSGLE
jgi:hypothetical protein